jgi:hypothetical protein
MGNFSGLSEVSVAQRRCSPCCLQFRARFPLGARNFRDSRQGCTVWSVMRVLSPGVRCVGMTSYAIGRHVCDWVERHRKSWKNVVSDRRHRRPSMSACFELNPFVTSGTYISHLQTTQHCTQYHLYTAVSRENAF